MYIAAGAHSGATVADFHRVPYWLSDRRKNRDDSKSFPLNASNRKLKY